MGEPLDGRGGGLTVEGVACRSRGRLVGRGDGLAVESRARPTRLFLLQYVRLCEVRPFLSSRLFVTRLRARVEMWPPAGDAETSS